MYVKNDLRDINHERADLICDAITELKKNVVPGRPYDAADLSVMTGRIIPASIFKSCLSRGYRACRIQRRDSYNLFNDWRAECHIDRKGKNLITIKEYDENGNLIGEYKKRRGRVYYTATFF